jgi:NADPH2:quinone reductase
MTAHYLAHSVHPLKPGDVCIVHSCAGGVGQMLCQMAKLRGARVIGTISTPDKMAAALAAGADHVLIYTREDVAAEARRLTGGTGVDVVYDAVGLETYEASMKALRPRGTLAFYGEASGDVPPLNVKSLLAHGSLVMTRTGLDHFVATRAEFEQRANDVLGWLADGTLKVEISREFPLTDVAGAHRAIEGRRTTGKIIVVP